jgi:hypothetical protein
VALLMISLVTPNLPVNLVSPLRVSILKKLSLIFKLRASVVNIELFQINP